MSFKFLSTVGGSPPTPPPLPPSDIEDIITTPTKSTNEDPTLIDNLLVVIQTNLNMQLNDVNEARMKEILGKLVGLYNSADFSILDKIWIMLPETDLTKEMVEERLGIQGGNYDQFDPTRPQSVPLFPAGSPQTINRDAIMDRVRVHQGIHLTFQIFSAIISIVVEVISVGQMDKIIENLQVIYSCAYSGSIYDRSMQIVLEASLLRPYQYLVEESYTSNIPPLSDLIVMLTREQLGDGEEGVTQFKKLMKYYGFNEFWSDAYWGSHWVLPNTQQLYDMFGRNIIDEETLKKQIIINDVKPEWVDSLVELSHRLPSRTEARMINRVRRMDSDKIDRILQSELIHEDFKEDYKLFIENQQLDNIYTKLIGEYSDQFEKGYIERDAYREAIADLNLSELEVDANTRLFEMRRAGRILDTDTASLRLEFRKRVKGIKADPDALNNEVSTLTNKLFTVIRDRALVDSIVDNEKARIGVVVDLNDDLITEK